jgi:cyclic pyranopterin phosphate synthase
MPAEGVESLSHGEVLRFEEVLRICRIMASLGIETIKVTGGEPLVRKGAADLIAELRAIEGVSRVTMTSNGVLLGNYLPALAAAGLDAVNISLDTLNDERFQELTGIEGLVNVLSAIDMSVELGLRVKVNCVPLKGFNEDDIVPLAAMAKDRDITVRFIELMPLGAASALQPLPTGEVISLIEGAFGPLKPSAAKLGFGPATYYTAAGFTGFIGIISAVSHGFCKTCNRLRLTASGFLKPCLSSDMGLDLRGLVRGGASDGEIAEAAQQLVAAKPAGHCFGDAGNINMYRIGG